MQLKNANSFQIDLRYNVYDRYKHKQKQFISKESDMVTKWCARKHIGLENARTQRNLFVKDSRGTSMPRTMMVYLLFCCFC